MEAVTCRGPVESSRTSPAEVLTRTSPSAPSPWIWAQAPVSSAREPVGSATVTSTEPVRPNRARCLGVRTVSRLFRKVTSVCSATRTSWSLPASRGRTSTVVSLRPVATRRIDPASTCTVAVIGSGVSKEVSREVAEEGMAVPSSGVFAASSQVGRGAVEVG